MHSDQGRECNCNESPAEKLKGTIVGDDYQLNPAATGTCATAQRRCCRADLGRVTPRCSKVHSFSASPVTQHAPWPYPAGPLGCYGCIRETLVSTMLLS